MPTYLTCHRRGYKLKDPNIWEVLDGHKSVGFVNSVSKIECGPPAYIQVGKKSYMNSLPAGSTVVDESYIDNSHSAELQDLEDLVTELRNQLAEHKGEERWLLTFTWGASHSPMCEEIWNLKTEKEATDLLDEYKSFYARSLVESITNVEVKKYFYRPNF